MVVNTIDFWLFFSAVLLPYFLLYTAGSKWQNIWLLLASYFFYGWADLRMLPLLAITTLVFYGLGIGIEKNIESNPKKASCLKVLGIILGVGVLFYFKYLGFFVNEFSTLFRSWGMNVGESTFSIVMPIGISFFTFKLMGYVLEVYNEEINAEKDIIRFGTFIAFFPTILSGPIDRAYKFLPQLDKTRRINSNDLSEGIRLVLWGMFLKMCIADRLIGYTDAVFNNFERHNGTSIIVATILYLIQLYSDFAGYSSMAIGVSRIMGIRVVDNFKRPFFAQNIAEYWRRWHMSLTTWITDYVFTPLNYSFRRFGLIGVLSAVMINLVLVGIWHGANWTYVCFGVYHGILFSIVLIAEKKRLNLEKRYQIKEKGFYIWSRRLITFMFCAFGAVLFRAPSVSDFFGTYAQLGKGLGYPFIDFTVFALGVPCILLMFAKEYIEENSLKIRFINSEKRAVRLASIILLISIIMLFGNLDGGSFIYFQF